MEVKQINAELNWTHVGQYNPYGATYRVCEIHTSEELNDADICLLVGNKTKPSKAAWDAKDLTAEEYFRGWYKVEKTDYGYLYTECEPYTD